MVNNDLAETNRFPIVLFAAALILTAVATLVHGSLDSSSEAVGDSSIWYPLHFVQTVAYFALAAAALAYGMDPSRSGTGRAAMALLALGALMAAFVHVIDGAVRVAMIDEGVAETHPLWIAVFELAAWPIIIGYAMIGIGGAVTAWGIAGGMTGAWRGVGIAATVFYGIGGLAGLAETAGGPLGLAWPLLALAWLWHGVTLARGLWTGTRAAAGATPA